MIFLNEIRDWIKTFGVAENYYIGKLDNKKDKSIGVYQLESHSPTFALGQESSYEIKRISLLIHWNKNQNESERAACDLYKKLKAVSSCNLNGTHVYFITLSHAEPVFVDTDGSGVYEWVIEFEICYEREE